MKNGLGLMVVISVAGAASLQAHDSTQQIYDRVASTFQLRDSRHPPMLRVAATTTGSAAKGAYLDLNAREIVIDQRLIDRFQNDPRLGDDAIAFVLGHELGHFYSDHRLAFAAASPSSGGASAEDRHQLDRLRSLEEEADRKGLLHSHLAGYRGAAIAPAAIESIYSLYNLSPELPGYPSLGSRTSGTSALVEALRPLLPLYPLALAMILTENLPEAASILEYLGNQFQSVDLRQNAAVLQARIGLSKTPNVARYAELYPFLFATQNNLGRSLGASRGGNESGRPHLEAAAAQFRLALRLAPQDPATRINLALVLDLLGRGREGLSLLNGDAGFLGPMKVHRLKAQIILWHHSGQTAKARQATRGLTQTDTSLWESFFRNVPPPRREPGEVEPPCPELSGLAERAGFRRSSLWNDGRVLKGFGIVPGDAYELSVQTVNSPEVFAARLRSFQTAMRVIVPLVLNASEEQGLSAYFQRTTPTSELAGFPVSYRLYKSGECRVVLGSRESSITDVFLLDRRW